MAKMWDRSILFPKHLSSLFTFPFLGQEGLGRSGGGIPSNFWNYSDAIHQWLAPEPAEKCANRGALRHHDRPSAQVLTNALIFCFRQSGWSPSRRLTTYRTSLLSRRAYCGLEVYVVDSPNEGFVCPLDASPTMRFQAPGSDPLHPSGDGIKVMIAPSTSSPSDEEMSVLYVAYRLVIETSRRVSARELAVALTRS